jgi:protein-serine/threonine kinase
MSSAALQSAPHQASAITSLSPAASPSNRQYNTQPQPQSNVAYHGQQASSASPSSTSRRPSRRPSGNGANVNSSQQPTYYSPTSNAPASAPVVPRSSNASNQAVPSSGYPATSPGEYQRGVPPVAPPRTSSNQRTSSAAASTDRSRRGGGQTTRTVTGGDGLEDATEAERSHGGRQVNGNERERAKEDAAAAASAASRSRRRAQQTPTDSMPPRSSSSREPRAAQSPSAVQSRAQAMTETSSSTPNGLSREPSEVLNRIVVSKPEVDIDRERERMVEAHPASSTSDSKPATEGVDDAGRSGQRSRHDHSSSKREKSTRFGEYFLGNTLGEGEFGKVKMGWKQEGGVQVTHTTP